jgi:hypothetical protein
MRRILVAFLGCTAFCGPALAQDVPVPKMLKDLQGQKGQYRVEILEGGGRAAKGTSITVCSENIIQDAGGRKPRAESGCRQQLLKDTDDEAVLESVCKDRTTKVSMKREGKGVLVDIASTTESRGERNMKMRYTHLGACREGQGALTLDKDSEQCRRLRARAEKMDPAKREQVLAMCNG